MRRITRLDLSQRVRGYLERKQRQVDAGETPRKIWKQARATKTMKQVQKTLEKMSGRRQRCMYCEDSRGTDIDHFWPMASYPQRTFVWGNLLSICTGCNRQKGIRFDLDPAGKPLLINPTEEDPWDFLYFEPLTGIITARVCARTGKPDLKGDYTADRDVLPLNIEPVIEGRRRTYRSLRRAVERFLNLTIQPPSGSGAQTELVQEILDHDDYGLVNWFFLKDGSDEPPFSVLRAQHRDVWASIVQELIA